MFQKMMDNLIVRLSYIRPISTAVNNNRGEIDPPAPPVDPPADPPPADPPPEANEFFDSFSEDNRAVNKSGVATLSKFKTHDDLGKAYRELETKIGQKGVIVPEKDASPEAREEYYNALGRPKTPEEYKLETVEGLHESVSVTTESENTFRVAAHKMGFTNDQVNELNQWYLGEVSNLVRAREKADLDASQATESALREEWKENYDGNVDKVAKMMGDEAIDAMGGKEKLGNNPTVLKALGKIANLMSEDQIGNIRSPVGKAAGNESQQDAITKINAMNSDPDNAGYKALMNTEHPGHKDAVEERTRLYEIAYPEESA